MINSVNSKPMIYQAQQIGQVQQPVPTNVPAQMVTNPNLSGANALATYNQPMGQTNRKVLTPTQPIILPPNAAKTLQGEKVLDPFGHVNYIIQQDGKNETVYTIDPTNDTRISKIETFDMATGKLVRIQENMHFEGNDKEPAAEMIFVDEINPNNDKLAKSTFYKEGKVVDVIEKEYGNDGSKTIYGYRFEENKSYIGEINPDESIYKETTFNKNGQIEKVETNNRNEFTKQIVEYFNGVPAKYRTETQEIIQNTTGVNPFTDPEIVPAQPYVLGYDPYKVEGNKQNYSNGRLAQIDTQTANGEIMHFFAPNGDLSNITDYRDGKYKSILFYKDSAGINQTIEEEISDNVMKSTSFRPDGDTEVSITNTNDKSQKHVHYSKEGVLLSYYQKDKDGNEMLLNFDKQGNLRSIE